jgi:NADH-quinone oxidoreductase subunit K
VYRAARRRFVARRSSFVIRFSEAAVTGFLLGALTLVAPLLLQAQSSALKRFEPTLVNFLMLSFLLFVVGVAGVLSRRNIIIIFMSIELILNAVNLNMIAFSRYLAINQKALGDAKIVVEPLTGPVFTIFIIVVAAAEAAVGLGIVIAMFRNRETIAIDEIDLLKW